MPYMMSANAKRYDWQTWMVGIMRSFLSGGAAALLTLGGGAAVGLDTRKTWIMMGFNFLGLGAYRMGEFLQLHGAPDQLQATLDAAAASAEETKKLAGQTAQAVAKAQDIAPEAVKAKP